MRKKRFVDAELALLAELKEKIPALNALGDPNAAVIEAQIRVLREGLSTMAVWDLYAGADEDLQLAAIQAADWLHKTGDRTPAPSEGWRPMTGESPTPLWPEGVPALAIGDLVMVYHDPETGLRPEGRAMIYEYIAGQTYLVRFNRPSDFAYPRIVKPQHRIELHEALEPASQENARPGAVVRISTTAKCHLDLRGRPAVVDSSHPWGAMVAVYVDLPGHGGPGPFYVRLAWPELDLIYPAE